VLTPALALTAVSGNASAYLIPLMAGAWVWRERPWAVGAIVAIAAAVKLTPAVLLIWLLAARRPAAVRATAAVAFGLLAISVVGAGVQNHVAWLRSVPESAPMPLSVAAWTGLPSFVVAGASALAAAVLASAFGRRGREDLAFAAALIASVAATPAFYFAALATCAVALVPGARSEPSASAAP